MAALVEMAAIESSGPADHQQRGSHKQMKVYLYPANQLRRTVGKLVLTGSETADTAGRMVMKVLREGFV